MEKLPYSEYEWVQNTSDFDFERINLDGDTGYILEVDLEYPKKYHYLHNDFPLAPETSEIALDEISKYSQKCFLASNNTGNYKAKKLVSTCFDRENYVVHIKNLRLYVSLGMKVKKIHRVLKFHQKSFLKPFIQKCTEERKKAITLFEKNQFKKVSNSCFGKTIENVRDYISVKLHTNEKTFKKAMSKHTFKNFSIIDENLVVTSHVLPKILHNKPYAIGFTILELVSKVLRFAFCLLFYLLSPNFQTFEL